MNEMICKQIVNARVEALRRAKHDIKAIVVKYQGRKDKYQLLEAELLRVKEYEDSNVGHGYINSLAPTFGSDEELINAMVDYYSSSQLTIPNNKIGMTEESIGEYVYEDSFTFFRRYYLAQYISKLMLRISEEQPEGETYSGELKRLFRNHIDILDDFIKRCRSQSYSARDVGYNYKMLRDKVIQPKRERGVKKSLCKELHKIGIISIGYGTFKTYL